MKPISLTEQESIVIGTKFGYVPPADWQGEYSTNWRYYDDKLDEKDVPVLEALREKKLVTHMAYADWPLLVDKDCWALTDEGVGIFNWFHCFPENYGL